MALRQLDLLSYLLIIILSSIINSSAHLKKLDYDANNPFNLSTGLYNCTMEDKFPLLLERRCSALDVLNIQAEVCLCCRKGRECEPCLQALLELCVTNEEDLENDEEDDADEESSTEGEEAVSIKKPAVNLCYTVSQALTHCKKVECTLHSKQENPNQSEWFGVVLLSGLKPGNTVHVTAEANHKVNTTVRVPTEAIVYSGLKRSDVKDFVDPPKLTTRVDLKKGEVKINVEDETHLVGMCLKSERTGPCLSFNRIIPLHSVTPCLCVQAWWENKDARSETCPFNNTTDQDLRKVLRQNVLDNISRSVVLSQTHSGLLALQWNVSVPCQVDVDVRPCQRVAVGSCHDVSVGKHLNQEGNDAWMGYGNGSWRKSGAFVNISSHLPLCIKLTVMEVQFGPLCPEYTKRWHWSIPIVAVVLMFSLIIFCLYLKRTTLEKWMRKWKRASLIQGGRGHVLLLHPPCEDPLLSELVCLLGSTLKSLDFSVSLDLWSHTELGSMGPVPWLHSQMELLRTRGGRALVVLSSAALKRAEEWSWVGWRGTRSGSPGGGDQERGPGRPSASAPPTDVFSAALSCLLEDHQRGGVSRRFALLQFDSHSPFSSGEVDPGLPLLFQGLNLYCLPTESRAFLDALMGHSGGLVRCWSWQSWWLSRDLRRRLQGTNNTTGERLPQILENSGETAPLQFSSSQPWSI